MTRAGVGLACAIALACGVTEAASAASRNYAYGFSYRGQVDTDVSWRELARQSNGFALSAWLNPQFRRTGRGPIFGTTKGPTLWAGMGDYGTLSQASITVGIDDQEASYRIGYDPASRHRWTHLAIVGARLPDDRIRLQVYINGSRETPDQCAVECAAIAPAPELVLSKKTLAQMAGDLVLGRTEAFPVNQFYGLIDEVQVFKQSISANMVLGIAFDGRMDGSVKHLKRGYTFDNALPDGKPFPALLQNDQVNNQWAQRTRVAKVRGNPATLAYSPTDAKVARRIPTRQDVPWELPFAYGVPWKVQQGYGEKLSHNGTGAVFSYDFIRADVEHSATCGSPVFAPAAGTAFDAETDGSDAGGDANHPDSNNSLKVDLGTPGGLQFRMLHLRTGSLSPSVKVNDPVFVDQHVADAGTRQSVDDEPDSNCHLHISGGVPGATVPIAFTDYELLVSKVWIPIALGTPQTGDIIRRVERVGEAPQPVTTPTPTAAPTVTPAPTATATATATPVPARPNLTLGTVTSTVAVIRNAGTADAGPFKVAITQDRALPVVFDIPGLGAGDSRRVTYACRNGSRTVRVDSTSTVAESNESDNTQQFTSTCTTRAGRSR